MPASCGEGKGGTLCTFTTVMIRRIYLLCNILKVKKISDLLYTYPEKDIPDLSRENCPACHARGMYRSHGSYRRYVIDLLDGKPVTHLVSIQRVKCACGHTHALLKDSIIPYCQYSLRFILQVLKAYFRRSRTVVQICDDFQISPPTLYRWKRLFLAHKELWLGLLRGREVAPLPFLQFIDRLPDISEFLHAFFLKASFSFLQSHRNPAYS